MTKTVCELYGTQEERVMLASDPQTTKPVLKRLLLEDVEEVQMAAAENPSTDWMALWEYLRLYPLKEGLSWEIRKRILKKQNIPKEMEKYITFEFVDSNPTIPQEVLEKLAEMPVKNAHFYYSPKTSPEMLEALVAAAQQEAPKKSPRREKLYQEYMRKHNLMGWISTADANSLKGIAEREEDEDILEEVLTAMETPLLTRLKVRFKLLKKRLCPRFKRKM